MQERRITRAEVEAVLKQPQWRFQQADGRWRARAQVGNRTIVVVSVVDGADTVVITALVGG